MSTRSLLLLTLAAFVLRAAFIVAEPPVERAGDEPTWIGLAIHGVLKIKRPFSPFHSPLLFYPPAYPYFMAAVRKLLGSFEAVPWAQALLGALTVPAIAWIGARFSPRVGLVAACLAAFYPDLLWYAAHLWSETLFLFLSWWAIERTFAADANRRATTAAVAGVLIGLAALTRETALPIVGGLALWLVWNKGKGALRYAAVLVAVAAFTVGLWTYRNYAVYRAFVPISTFGSFNLWLGNTDLPRAEVYRRVEAIPDAIEQDRLGWVEARRSIAARQPWWIFEKIRSEMPGFWGAGSEAYLHVERGAYGPVSPSATVTARRLIALPYLAVLAAAFLGAAVLRPVRGWGLLLGLVAYYNAVHVAAFAADRFRVPIMPVLFLLAGVAWEAWRAGELRERLRERRALAAAMAAAFLAIAVWSLT